MPLRASDRQPLAPNPTPPDTHPTEKIFYCEPTKEVFKSHSEYVDRLVELKQNIWMCAVSFKKGMTYLEAQQSEEKLATRIAQLPIPIHRALCCLVAHFGSAKVEKLSEACYLFLKDRFLIGEPVLVEGKGGVSDFTIAGIRVKKKKGGGKMKNGNGVQNGQNGHQDGKNGQNGHQNGKNGTQNDSDSDDDMPLSQLKLTVSNSTENPESGYLDPEPQNVIYTLSNGKDTKTADIRRPTSRNNSGSYLSREIVKFWVRCCCDFDGTLNYQLKPALRNKALNMNFNDECHPVIRMPQLENTGKRKSLTNGELEHFITSQSKKQKIIPLVNGKSYGQSNGKSNGHISPKGPKLSPKPKFYKTDLPSPKNVDEARKYYSEMVKEVRSKYEYFIRVNFNKPGEREKNRVKMLELLEIQKQSLKNWELKAVRDRELKLQEERVERQKEKVERQKLKPQIFEKMKNFANPVEDLEILNESENLAKPDSITQIGLKLESSLFGDVLAVLEFFNGGMLNKLVEHLKEVVEESGDNMHFVDVDNICGNGLKYSDIESALLECNSEGPLNDLLFSLFPICLYEERKKYSDDEYVIDLKTQINKHSNHAAAWSEFYTSRSVFDIPIDSGSISELLRLYFLASGARRITRGQMEKEEAEEARLKNLENEGNEEEIDENDKNDENDESFDEDFEEIPMAYQFCLDEADLLKELEKKTVFELKPKDKLKILTCLINIVLYSKRGFVTELLESVSSVKSAIDELKRIENIRFTEARKIRTKKHKEVKSMRDQIAKLGKNDKTAPLSPNPGNKDDDAKVSTPTILTPKTQTPKTLTPKTQTPKNPDKNLKTDTKLEIPEKTAQTLQLESEIVEIRNELENLENDETNSKQEYNDKLAELYSELFENEKLTRVPCMGRDRFHRTYYSVNGCIVVEETENVGFAKAKKGVSRLSKEDLDPNFPSWFKTKSEYPANYAWLLDTKLDQSRLLEVDGNDEKSENEKSDKFENILENNTEIKTEVNYDSDKENAVKCDKSDIKSDIKSEKPEILEKLEISTPISNIQHWPKTAFAGSNPDWFIFKNTTEVKTLLTTLNIRGERERDLYKKLTKWIEYTDLSEFDDVFSQSTTHQNAQNAQNAQNTQKASKSVKSPQTTTKTENVSEASETRLEYDILTLEEDLFESGLANELYKGKKDVDEIRNKWRDDYKFDKFEPLIIDLQDETEIPGYIDYLGQDRRGLSILDRHKHALITLMRAIPIRFLHEPFGTVRLRKRYSNRTKKELLPDKETLQNCHSLRNRWEFSLSKSKSASQICVHMSALQHFISFEYSVAKAKCEVCRKVGQADQLLFCDLCNLSSHTYCLKPALKKIPEGDWFCRDCKNMEIDEVDLSFIKELLGKVLEHEFSYPFVKPVTRKLAPDYFDIISEPIDLQTMRRKFDKNKYHSSEQICADIKLMFTNCYEYNKPGSLIYKEAKELELFVKNELLTEFGIEDEY